MLPRINDCTPSAVFVEMPKVELDNKHDVLAMADKLGIKDGVYGGFTQLTPDSLVAVSSIVQGATLSVTEQGTVASAATAVVGVKGGAMIAENELICNRPYAMVIYHVETGSVLFVSVVNDVG
jgi:serpin B